MEKHSYLNTFMHTNLHSFPVSSANGNLPWKSCSTTSLELYTNRVGHLCGDNKITWITAQKRIMMVSIASIVPAVVAAVKKKVSSKEDRTYRLRCRSRKEKTPRTFPATQVPFGILSLHFEEALVSADPAQYHFSN